jgi:hypothetical protein
MGDILTATRERREGLRPHAYSAKESAIVPASENGSLDPGHGFSIKFRPTAVPFRARFTRFR